MFMMIYIEIFGWFNICVMGGQTQIKCWNILGTWFFKTNNQEYLHIDHIGSKCINKEDKLSFYW